MRNIIIFIILLVPCTIPAQESLKSIEENYYDFLSLQGFANRPTLNYRTLSDSVWAVDEAANHPWLQQNLGTFHPLFGAFRLRVYGPELFISGNTAAPYGQNDGLLWQGRGFNAQFKGGARIEGYGIELTLLPHLAFSQNAAFDYITPNYNEPQDIIFINKAGKYGYYGLRSIDAPQRFGDEAFFRWDFGDSEIRYTWKTVTVGFGTQAIWLGPAYLNPIIHSNNAPSYPKFDLGIRRQPVTIPGLNWHIGDIEFRGWWGYLSESDWFDNNDSNDHNLITGVAVAYGFPSILKGLTVGFNRIMLSKWETRNFAAIFSLLLPSMDGSLGMGNDEADQRASVIIDYLLPVGGINIFFEWGRNDYSPSADYIIRYPFHTEGYTVGIKKSLPITATIKGEIVIEFTNLECSQDYDRLLSWSSTFYAHHIISQGHTNRGQWMGAGIGTGGNSQYLETRVFFPKGYVSMFFQRRNPDLDYSYFIDSKKHPEEFKNGNFVSESNIRAFFDIGISGMYCITPDFHASTSVVFRDEHNPLNKSVSLSDHSSVHRYNWHFSLLLKYYL